MYQCHISPSVQQRITVFPENAEIWIGSLFHWKKSQRIISHSSLMQRNPCSVWPFYYLTPSSTCLPTFQPPHWKWGIVQLLRKVWLLTNTWNDRSVSKRNWNWFAGSENSVGWQSTSYPHFRLSHQIPITRWWLGKHEINFSLIEEPVFCLLYVPSSWELWRNTVL